MKWNWQKKDWPKFTFDQTSIEEMERKFLYEIGVFLGGYTHLSNLDKNALVLDYMSDEACNTSKIEGEYLNRDSVQSSIKKYLGLQVEEKERIKVTLAEQGIAEMMVHLHRSIMEPLSHEILFLWHKMIFREPRVLESVGQYRTHLDAMQVISGEYDAPQIHFEAPPSHEIYREVEKFIQWFNETHPTGKTPLPPLTRAAIAHLYFECIHPFEDGNGRIGRALVEKSLSQSVGKDIFIALSRTIEKNKKNYYQQLEKSNKDLEITSWIVYFANTILNAQNYTHQMAEFLIKKAKFYEQFKSVLNERQLKVIKRIFKEGVEGFKGGVSAENYISITKTSRATATRDLHDLVEKKIFKRTGELKGTRYYLNFE